MTCTGKKIRLKRIFDGNGKAVIFAPVHNMTSVEPFLGQIDVCKSIKAAIKGGATAQVISKGFLKRCAQSWDPGVGIINYMFTYAALSPNPIKQVPVTSVEESLRLGADGVCFFAGLSTEDDAYVLELMGRISEECDKYGLVFICEAEFPGFYNDMKDNMKNHGLRYLKYTARICSELGADAVSVNWPGNMGAFAEIVDYVKIPVLINGGAKMPEEDFLTMVHESIKAGSSGCLVGRNISESQDIEKMTRAVTMVIRQGMTADEALKTL
jgi:fructose-bisphosphate aldolase / 2-amino-3,7-dideoxy-D-threo-hept-6-ulosonate synthase